MDQNVYTHAVQPLLRLGKPDQGVQWYNYMNLGLTEPSANDNVRLVRKAGAGNPKGTT